MKLTDFFKASTVALAITVSSSAIAGAWDDYKALYMQDDGAITDTYNNNMSHSEGQSYGLLFALAYNDQEAFDKIFSWTQAHMLNPETNLHYWAYKPAEQDPTADHNNATDGDLLMAWTLLKAGKAFGNSQYTKEAEKLALAIADHCTEKMAHFTLLLPGVESFFKNSSVIINPSYYIFPALRDLAQATHQKVFEDLYTDGKKVLATLAQGKLKVNLPPDWVDVSAQGELTPAQDWPARSSYDAIRVPLYVYWDDPNSELLSPWKTYFSSYQDDKNPAWVNITTGEVADYMLPAGLAAVRAMVLGYPVQEPQISKDDDYYNASLKLLTFLASKHF